MKIFYLVFAFLQFIFALISRDQNRSAYLMYLLGRNLTKRTSPSKSELIQTTHPNYKETKAEANSNEYSLLLER